MRLLGILLLGFAALPLFAVVCLKCLFTGKDLFEELQKGREL